MKSNTCCFFGHRTINETDELKAKLYKTIDSLVVNENVDTNYLISIENSGIILKQTAKQQVARLCIFR